MRDPVHARRGLILDRAPQAAGDNIALPDARNTLAHLLDHADPLVADLAREPRRLRAGEQRHLEHADPVRQGSHLDVTMIGIVHDNRANQRLPQTRKDDLISLQRSPRSSLVSQAPASLRSRENRRILPASLHSA